MVDSLAPEEKEAVAFSVRLMIARIINHPGSSTDREWADIYAALRAYEEAIVRKVREECRVERALLEEMADFISEADVLSTYEIHKRQYDFAARMEECREAND